MDRMGPLALVIWPGLQGWGVLGFCETQYLHVAHAPYCWDQVEAGRSRLAIKNYMSLQ